MKTSSTLLRHIYRLFRNTRAHYLLVLAALLVPNVILDINEHYDPATAVANILIPSGFYALLLSYRRRIGTGILLSFPFMILAAFQLVLCYLYGESIIAVDMFINVVTTNVDEVNELLGNLVYAIATVVLLYLPPLVWAVVATVKRWELPQQFARAVRRGGLYALCAGAALCVAIHVLNLGPAVHRTIFPVNVICNLIEAVERTRQVAHYAETSAHFNYEAHSERNIADREVYVMVIGETSRALNWELAGYGRPTNPRLKQESGVVFFPKALSESNTTHKSVPMLLCPVTAENFDSIYYFKSIITAMKQAGFRTYFLSNQAANRSFTQFFGDEANVVRYTEVKATPHPYDGELAMWLSEIITNSIHPKQFFVLHTYGSHFLYRDRYPADQAYFQPDDAIDANRANRKSLINGYDNSIRYTDKVLSDIIKALKTIDGRAAMVYSADHGEDIFDDSRSRFLHASPNPTYFQLHVASLAWINDSLASEYPEYLQNLTKNSKGLVSPQKSLFHTTLEMAGISTPRFNRQHSLVNSDYRISEPVYVTDINTCVPLRLAGMKPGDLTKINNLLTP